MSETSAAHAALVAAWADAFNADIDRLIDELYSPECRFLGAELGPDRLRRLEQRVLAAAPRRAVRVDRTHSSGDDVVTVEGVLVDPDQGPEWALPFCAVLTWHGGKVVDDNTYADMTRWPGMLRTS